MRKGTYYAKKLKQAYSKFRGSATSEPASDPTEPVNQLLVATLSQETTVSQAEKALKQINDHMVDHNELRVSSPAEIAEPMGKSIPKNIQRAKALKRVLNAIYQNEHVISLDILSSKGVREIKSYLDNLDGTTPYVVASVLLWSIGGHAIPINDPTLEFLKREKLVGPDAECAEVQSFLERHVSATDAKGFCLDLQAYAASKLAQARNTDKSRSTRASTKTKSSKNKKSTRKTTTGGTRKSAGTKRTATR